MGGVTQWASYCTCSPGAASAVPAEPSAAWRAPGVGCGRPPLPRLLGPLQDPAGLPWLGRLWPQAPQDAAPAQWTAALLPLPAQVCF